MSTFGQVPLNDVLGMLTQCAPGHQVKERTHHFCVNYKNKTFPSLPKGTHGKANPSIQKGIIKKMARHLGILACAKRVLSL